MAFLNGQDIAVNLTKRKMPESRPGDVAKTLAKISAEILGKKPLTDTRSPQYHLNFLSFLNQAQKQGIPPDIALAFSAIFLNRLEQESWENCSKGQDPILFLASNTSEVDPHVIFGNGTVSDGRMSGYFGLCMNARKAAHVEQADDFVPFSYMFAHSKTPPAAILFFGAYLPAPGEDDFDIQSKIENAASLVLMRKERYVKRAVAARHWIEDDLYLHVPSSDVTHAAKIPIIAAIYDGRDRVVRVINAAGKPAEPLRAFMEKHADSRRARSKGVDSRLAKIAVSLQRHEQDESYSLIALHARGIKQIGCVDARISHMGDMRGLIKEIGSALTVEQMARIASSPFSSALILGGHTSCGYLNALLHVHMANNKLREIFGDKKCRLRRMLESSLSELSKGNTSVPLNVIAVQNAIEHNPHLKNAMSASKGENDFICGLLCDPADDLRFTLFHAISRGAIKIGDDGLLTMPAAAAVEQMARSLLPSATFLTSRAFDLLLTEEATRMGLDSFKGVLDDEIVKRKMFDARGSAEFDVAPMITDLETGARFSPPDKLPQSEEELGQINRSLFYRPDKKVALLTETIAK